MPVYDSKTKKATVDMYQTDRFIQAGDNLKVLACRMVENEVLCKLLVRNEKSVLADKKPITEKEKTKAFNEHISTIPVLDKAEDSKTTIVLQIGDIVPMQPRGLSYTIVFDIICNIDNWNLDNYIQRPYAIMNELDSILSNTKMSASWGPTTFLGATSIKINERTLGYTMMFSFAEIQ